MHRFASALHGLRMPTSPLCPTFLRLNLENWFDGTPVGRIFRVSHVSGCFAEANQLVVRNRLDALPELFHRELFFGDHLCP
jgi:hypothetical protein